MSELFDVANQNADDEEEDLVDDDEIAIVDDPFTTKP